MISDHPGQRLKLCLAAHHGNLTPPRISPSCPFQDRSTNAGAVIARQIGHDLLYGRSDPLPTLLAAFMQILCTGGSSRSLQCRCPFSVFTRHTNGCISVSGYVLYKIHVKRILFSLFCRFPDSSNKKFSKSSQKLHYHFHLRQNLLVVIANDLLRPSDPLCILCVIHTFKIYSLNQLSFCLWKHIDTAM